MKRITALLLICLFLLSGCGAPVDEDLTPNHSTHITVPENQSQEQEAQKDAPDTEEPTENTPVEQPPKEETPKEETPKQEETSKEETPTPDTPEQEEPQEEETEQSAKWTTSCMSFNILERNTGSQSLPRPEVRAPWIVETIRRYDPDLLGCQEVTRGTAGKECYDMYSYLTGQLSAMGYAFSGMMDSQGKPGSKMTATRYSIGAGLVIFWKKDRFELKDFGANIYSNSNVRHYQWVKLYDKQENITILMTNTHMAADNPPRVSTDSDFALQATELYRFWEKNCKKDMPLYATGDYNRQPNTTAYTNLMQGRYMNSADCAYEANAVAWIDHVFINTEVQECIKYHRCNDTFEPKGVAPANPNKRNTQYCASDHYAVVSYCSNL